MVWECGGCGVGWGEMAVVWECGVGWCRSVMWCGDKVGVGWCGGEVEQSMLRLAST